MKKRILCICLTAVLLISLTGCSAADTLTQLSVTYEKHLEKKQKKQKSENHRQRRTHDSIFPMLLL